MAKGKVEAIFLSGRRVEPLASVLEVQAVAGHGLVGEHHFQEDGPDGSKHEPQRELTLIESETFDALARDHELVVAPEQARRNILTRGVPLNHLIGVEFAVGEVKVRGLELCEPCGHLQNLTSPGFRKALIHRGGLRATIISDGMIRIGDLVTFDTETEETNR